MDKKTDLYEKNKYENTSFPFEIYYVKKYSMTPPGRGFDNLHWHEEIQYTIATKGNLTIQVNGQNYLLKEGEAIFINSQYLHITKEMDEDGRYFSINFSTKLLSFFLGSMMEQEYVVPYVNDYLLPVIVFKQKIPWEKQVLSHFYEIENVYLNKTDIAWEYKISSLLSQIWYLILSHAEVKQKGNIQFLKKKQERIQLLINFVKNHFTEELTIEDIAASAHISVSECTRCFKEYTDYSPYEYLIQYRISEASALLLQSNQTINNVAIKTGFSDTTSFIRAFRKRVGQTPLQYRKAHS
ncbi:hypothetical protein IGI39_004380 [Enterococcus sp. AZ135]|uniref:AraC family transcriptional regulator n=1 Tax=unclassified Enterococcus TaxID=2608891 RepID=UPI003F25ABA6